jgi:hypothetical protein
MIEFSDLDCCQYWVRVMGFNATFNNISVISVMTRGSIYKYISVHITTDVVSSNTAHDEVYSIKHYVINLSVICSRSVIFSGDSISFINKIDPHVITDITDILLNVALNPITLTQYWQQSKSKNFTSRIYIQSLFNVNI